MIKTRHVPNLLTVYRILAVPLVAYLWSFESPLLNWISFGIYSLACLSDYLDGYLTRLRRHWSSNFGKMLDPISDKIMVMAVLLLMVADRTIYGIHLLPAMLILIREVGVSGLREFLSELKIKVPVSRLAKWKTTAQMVALGLLIPGHNSWMGFPLRSTGIFLLWIAAVLTLITGYQYLHKSLPHISLDPLKERRYRIKIRRKKNKRLSKKYP